MMEKEKSLNRRRAFGIGLMVLAVMAGTCRVSWPGSYECTSPDHSGAICTTSGDMNTDSKVTFTCKVPPEDAVERTCSRIYSPYWSETTTGVRGHNWLCDGGITVHDTVLKDQKAMCAKLCGICAGAWK